MKTFLKTLWSKVTFIKVGTEENGLQINVNYVFLFGLVIGAITVAVLW